MIGADWGGVNESGGKMGLTLARKKGENIDWTLGKKGDKAGYRQEIRSNEEEQRDVKKKEREKEGNGSMGGKRKKRGCMQVISRTSYWALALGTLRALA